MTVKTSGEHLFTNKALQKLLFPIMIEQLLASLMGTIDTMMVSNVGSSAISAVSLVDSINILVIQAFAALAAGGTILCSQYLGSDHPKEANRAASQVLLVTASLATAVSLLSFPFIGLYNAGASVFRAQNNSKGPMTISVISNFLNIFGNALLIWGFHLGVAGAAVSTLISRIFCAVVVLWQLRNPDNPISVRRYYKIRPEFSLIKKVLSIGIPSGIENSMFQFGKLAIQSTVSTLGTAAIAAQAMTNILESLNGVAAMGVGIGLMTVVGQCIGANRKEEAVYYIKKLSWFAEFVMIISCLTVFVLAKPVTILGGMEPESARMCLFMVAFITVTKPLAWVPSFVPAYGMRAAGDVKFSMITSCASMWLCRVSLSIFLCRFFGFGPIAVWIGMFADWTVRGIIFLLRFRSRKWLNHHVIG